MKAVFSARCTRCDMPLWVQLPARSAAGTVLLKLTEDHKRRNPGCTGPEMAVPYLAAKPKAQHPKLLLPADVRKAVRELRTAFGQTQTEFAGTVGRSLPTIQRWETLVEPKGNALLRLAKIAQDSRQPQLTQTFRKAFHQFIATEYRK